MQKIELSLPEALPIGMYLLALLYVGLRDRGHNESREDFILGGRLLTLPAFVATLVTTWYGGILGVGEFTYLYGISTWVVFGLPYYVFALLFAFLIAGKVRASGALSIPERFRESYGNGGGVLSAVYIFFITLPAPYCLMTGLFLQLITGWPLWLCVLLGTLFSMAYVLAGGFRSVVRTDRLQFMLMFGGFAVLLIALVMRFGGVPFLQEHLPVGHLSWHGGNPPQAIVVWFFIALWTFVDPGFHQRCYAATTPKIARRGIVVSVGFWLVFDCMTTACGLYARALLPDINPVLAFPLLGHHYLPSLLSGLFLAGLLATIMSTLDSFSLLCAITLGYDLRRNRDNRTGDSTAIKAGLLLTAVLSIGLALLVPSVVQIWYIIGTLFVPPLLLPMLAIYFPRLQPGRGWILATLITAFLTSLLFLLLAAMQSESLLALVYYRDIPPMYPGLAVSLLLFAAGLLQRRPAGGKANNS